MLNVKIFCIGSIKEKYFKDAILEYQKRLTDFCKFSILELPEYKISNNPSNSDINKALTEEGKRVLSKIKDKDEVVSLCIEGKELSSVGLSKYINDAALTGHSTVDFIIGGSFGLSDEVKNRSNLKLSMSQMTFTHQMSRVILCEQIYRAFNILNGGKYHK